MNMIRFTVTFFERYTGFPANMTGRYHKGVVV
jgi:hypothetical protein